MDFYSDPSNVSKYIEMCEDYDGTELYTLLRKHLEKDSTLLELGCGPGNDITVLKDSYDITGSDTSEIFLNLCKQKFDNISFENLDAVTIKTESQFDCIYSNKVLHHLDKQKLEESLKRQQQVILPGGVFAHSFWLGEKEFFIEGAYFLYHNKDWLFNQINKYFTVVDTLLYKEFEENDSIFIIANNDKME